MVWCIHQLERVFSQEKLWPLHQVWHMLACVWGEKGPCVHLLSFSIQVINFQSLYNCDLTVTLLYFQYIWYIMHHSKLAGLTGWYTDEWQRWVTMRRLGTVDSEPPYVISHRVRIVRTQIFVRSPEASVLKVRTVRIYHSATSIKQRVTVKSGQGAVSGITGQLIDKFFRWYVETEWSVLDFPEVSGTEHVEEIFRLKG